MHHGKYRANMIQKCHRAISYRQKFHAPEQLRPIRVKRRIAAAVVLEVDAVDGGQQVAPPFVFVGVLVQLARAALMVL